MATGVIGQGQAAQAALDDCRVPLAELRRQWEDQKRAQLSIRARESSALCFVPTHSNPTADAPARLKKELDAVLTLQTDLDNISSTISMAKSQLQASQAFAGAIPVIKSLESTHAKLMEKVEDLYASLNVHNSFPELKGIDLDFIRILLLARDLKINIRKRAIGSFFEWERLDQAVGGKNQPLGNSMLFSILFY
jgi:hypothetical protein